MGMSDDDSTFTGSADKAASADLNRERSDLATEGMQMNMRKVVINKCYGGFSLSPEALLKLWDRGMKEIGTPIDEYYGTDEKFHSPEAKLLMGRDGNLQTWRAYLAAPLAERRAQRRLFLTAFSPDEKWVLGGGRDLPRDHAELVRVVEEMGETSHGSCASLAVVEIPDDVEWEIEEYDGTEWIAEAHRTWR